MINKVNEVKEKYNQILLNSLKIKHNPRHLKSEMPSPSNIEKRKVQFQNAN